MFCTKCGSNVGDSAFCPNCGAKVEAPKQQAQVTPEVTAEPVMSTPVEPVVDNSANTASGYSDLNSASILSGNMADSDATTVLSSEEADDAGATTILSEEADDAGATTVLSEEAVNNTASNQEPAANQFASFNQFNQQPQGQQAPTQQAPAQDPMSPIDPMAANGNFNNANFNNGNFNNANQSPIANNPAFYGMDQPVPKKKKKWPKIAAIVAAICILLGVGAYFAYPYVIGFINPKSYAVASLKKTTSNLESTVNGLLTNNTLSNVSTSQDLSFSLKLDQAVVGTTNYLSDIKATTLNFDLQIDSKNTQMSGTIGLGSSAGSNIIEVQFYADSNNIKFKIPKLFSESITITTAQLEKETGMDFDTVLGMMGSVDASQVQAMVNTYSSAITAGVKVVVKGIDSFIENCEYEKIGSDTYKASNRDIDVQVYDMTITEAAVKTAAKKIVEEAFADSTLSQYLTFVTMYGYSKDKMLAEIDSASLGIPSIKFNIYFSKNQELVKLELDLAQLSSTLKGKASIEFTGEKKLTDYIAIYATIDDANIRAYINNETEGKNKFEITVAEINDGKETGQYLAFKTDMTTSSDGKKLSIDNMEIISTAKNAPLNIKASGSMEVRDFTSLKNSSASFSNAVSLYNMTTKQETTIQAEIIKNITVLKDIVSDNLYKQITSGMGSSSSSSSSSSLSGLY